MSGALAMLKRPKTYLYVGGGVAALVAAKWIAGWLRSKRQALGDGYTLEIPRLAAPIRNQIAKAKAGKLLTDYRQAEDLSMFWKAPAYDAEAFEKGAYWLAVGARLTNDPSLLSKASFYHQKGKNTWAIPGSSLMTSNVSTIMRGAADALRPFAARNKQVKAIMTAAFSQSDPGKIATRQQAEREQDPVRATTEALTKSAADTTDLVSSVALWVRDGIGLTRPDGSSAPWWRTWLVRGGVLAAALVGARFAFGGHYQRAKEAVGGAMVRVKGAHAALTGAE